MTDKQQTARSFSEKWHNNPQLAFETTLSENSDTQNWILARNGLDGLNGLKSWLAGRRRILDAGCGNGRVTALLRRHAPLEAEVVGIDLTAADVAQENLANAANVHFEQRDLLGDLSGLGEFDLVYCQEVLHHTGDAAAAFHNLAQLLSPSGEIAIYVYKLKPPVREFTDDFVRGRISALPYAEAMAAMEQVTELGRALSDLQVQVTVPAVDVLEIPAGTYDIQRLIYNFLAKCYWNPELGVDGSTGINYDWYHPQFATRHTLDEVERWFAAEGLEVIHKLTDPYGITVRGTRQG